MKRYNPIQTGKIYLQRKKKRQNYELIVKKNYPLNQLNLTAN